ncbi:MAG TPA: PQQ-dependent sugar dehydrogenase [Kofleriaceae bacterium]
MRGIWLIALVLACKHSVERPPPPTAPPIGSAAAGAGSGSTTLHAVPPDIASHVTLVKIATGLVRPVLLTAAPGDPRKRLFVVEQQGDIKVIENGAVAAKPFFAITGLSHENEEGLLGLAFHPKFAENKRLYVYFTAFDQSVHIVEYKADASGDAVDMASARELIRIEHPYTNHNGGNLVFGPDGKLWAGIGDGGAANDPHRNGQNPKALLAKMLAFDVDGDRQPVMKHLGVRNPWRFWFDARTRDLYIGDVGQNLWESVYVLPDDGKVHNLGWNVVEGNHCFDAETGQSKASCDKTGFTAPVIDYSHEEGCSITGGVTYRGKAVPALDGLYFYADFCTGIIRSFRWDNGVHDHWDWRAALVANSKLEPAQISSFGVDGDGEVYLISLTGSIYRFAAQ